MSLVKPNLVYRIAVRFEPPLSSVAQLRSLLDQLRTPRTVLVGLDAAGASILVKLPPGKDLSRIDYGREWFKVPSGFLGPLSSAVIQTIRPESRLTF